MLEGVVLHVGFVVSWDGGWVFHLAILCNGRVVLLITPFLHLKLGVLLVFNYSLLIWGSKVGSRCVSLPTDPDSQPEKKKSWTISLLLYSSTNQPPQKAYSRLKLRSLLVRCWATTTDFWPSNFPDCFFRTGSLHLLVMSTNCILFLVFRGSMSWRWVLLIRLYVLTVIFVLKKTYSSSSFLHANSLLTLMFIHLFLFRIPSF